MFCFQPGPDPAWGHRRRQVHGGLEVGLRVSWGGILYLGLREYIFLRTSTRPPLFPCPRLRLEWPSEPHSLSVHVDTGTTCLTLQERDQLEWETCALPRICYAAPVPSPFDNHDIPKVHQRLPKSIARGGIKL